MTIEVIKFGGSSLVNSEAMRRVGEVLLQRRATPKVAVLSAMGGVTNALLELGHLACSGDQSYQDHYTLICERHKQVIKEFFPQGNPVVEEEVDRLLTQLFERCKGVYLLRELSAKSQDILVSFGERLSVVIMSTYLTSLGLSVHRWNALTLISTDDQHGAARVDMARTKEQIDQAMLASKGIEVCVVEGFIGTSPTGALTTLGRGGSDYTASLIASFTDAKHMEKSTDVPGMLTADPRLVPSARIISQLSYEEAMELCHFGAKVIYPPTLTPLKHAGVPLVVKSTFGDHPGTVISGSANSVDMVRGLSSIDGMALITLVGGGMVGVPGFSRRLFMSLSLHEINVVLITQSSSEHSITVAVEEPELDRAISALEEEFGSDRQLGRIEPFRAERGLSILAVVGDGMRQQVGICGRAFAALGQNGVNVRAVAQGSTERNISIVISSADVSKALRALHHAFFDGDVRRVHLVCVGVGQVGTALLDQLSNMQARLLDTHHLDLRVIAFANSRKALIDPEGLSLNNWTEQLEHADELRLDELLDRVIALNLENTLFVDNTASHDVAESYERLLSTSIGVIASNKIAASSAMNRYQDLIQRARHHRTQFHFEANVGAGLPVIDTIKHLIQSGDQVRRIEAVLSGTLNYIFSNFGTDCSLQNAVKGAMQAGFTEPDPRLDLNGVDVQRKILILAREAGYHLELEEIVNIPLLPQSVMDQPSVESFLASLPLAEAELQQQLQLANQREEALRYVASFFIDESGKIQAEVGMKRLAKSHVFCGLHGSDNAVMIWTNRYQERPLIIQGAGAGAEVTAMGVFADIMRFAQRG